MKGDLSVIHMLSSREGYAMGTKILTFTSGEWKIFSGPNAPGSLSCLQVIDRTMILCGMNDITTNSGGFYVSDGRRWSELVHPLGNMPTAVKFFKDGTGWCGGLGELARFDGRRWEMLLLSPRMDGSAIVSIEASAIQDAWVLQTRGRLSRVEGSTVKPCFQDTVIQAVVFLSAHHGYALGRGIMYEYKNGRWAIHSRDSLLENCYRLSPLPSGTIWAVGAQGRIVRWSGRHWQRYASPTTQTLNEIQMISETEGWAVGNKGTILHYASAEPTTAQSLRGGFEKRRISRLSMDINNVYGVAIDDLDGDGLKDVYAVLIFQPNHAYLQRPTTDAGFVEEEVQRGITGFGLGENENVITDIDLGVGMADVDNDGDLDLYLCKLVSNNRLYLNNGSGFFRDVSNQRDRGVGARERSNSVAFADVDLDGNLDMFVTNEETSNRFYLGDGNGYFADVTEQAGLKSSRGGMCAMFGDLDGDGNADLVVTNWGTPNKIYRNDTKEVNHPVFTDVTSLSTVGDEPWAKSNGVCLADVNNDGRLDIFVAKRRASNRLYLNEGGFHFKDVTQQALGIDSMNSYGASLFDFDHDGLLDLYVANVGDNVLYHNVGGERFEKVTAQYGLEFGGYSTGTATGDIDNDGDIDLFVGVFTNGASYLCENTINDQAFLKLRLEGVVSNRDAIGAKIWVYEAGHAGERSHIVGYREVTSGSGYASHDAREVHLGLGSRSSVDVVIDFPASKTQITRNHVAAGQTLVIQELEGFAATRTRAAQLAHRLATDRELHVEAAKFIAVFVIVVLSVLQMLRRYHWSPRRAYGLHAAVVVVYILQNSYFFSEGFFLAMVSPILTVLAILSLSHLIAERHRVVHAAAVEKQSTRDQIARDLHDDIASTLGSALIYLDALRRARGRRPKKEQMLLANIYRLLLETEDAISDIVWSVSPRRDKLDDLLGRIGQLVSDSCEAHDLESEISIDVPENSYVLHDTVRRNLFFVFKEAMANALKHARPTTISYRALLERSILMIRIEDDGKGFDLAHGEDVPVEMRDARHGNGLVNMKARAQAVGATLRLTSTPGKGTVVELIYDMTQMHH
jgi:signal transduction histidine kinase